MWAVKRSSGPPCFRIPILTFPRKGTWGKESAAAAVDAGEIEAHLRCGTDFAPVRLCGCGCRDLAETPGKAGAAPEDTDASCLRRLSAGSGTDHSCSSYGTGRRSL